MRGRLERNEYALGATHKFEEIQRNRTTRRWTKSDWGWFLIFIIGGVSFSF